MQARQNANGQYVRNVEATKKIQGSQFIKIIKGIAESKLYGYTLIEINPTTDPITGKLNDVNLIERRNVLPEQKTVLKRQGIWLPNWDLEAPKYKKNYILINSGDLGLFSATTPLILAKKFTLANYICRTHQRRIQNLINMDSFCLNPFAQFLCLCMSKFCKCNIRRATDFILYIPDCLSMSCKIEVCHRICSSCLFYQDTTISNP